MAFIKILVIVACITIAKSSQDADIENNNVVGRSYRLPNDTIPVHYDISITTHIHDNGRPDFQGRVRITIQAIQATNVITVQIRQLDIQTVNLLTAAGTTIQNNVPITLVPEVEFLEIRPTTPLVANLNYTVDITYNGIMRDYNKGFYRSWYRNENNETVWLATTQFQATDARHAFPCYDEPQIRGTYAIHLTHHSNYTAFSNWPESSRVASGPDYVTTTFETTFRIQTYIMGFIVADFKILDHAVKEQRILARPEAITNNEGVLGLENGEKMLTRFEEYLHLNYTAPKMDQAALPDFDLGAMENWGIMIYREERLLFDPAIGTTRQRDTILRIVAHEVVHTWFGNYVAPRWWDYLWLNEGLAALYERFLPSLVYPEERWMDGFVTTSAHIALEIDANPNVRPMTHYVENPVAIWDLFLDDVAYSKSGNVIRMIQNAIGLDTWASAMTIYLERNAFDSATGSEFYEALQAAVDTANPGTALNVATIMTTWEIQPGYPVITVSRNGNQLTFTQERFFFTDSTSDSIWWVPINYATASNPNFTDTSPDFWMNARTMTTTISNSNVNDWIIVNLQETSHYRVNYDNTLWTAITHQLWNNFQAIHHINRAQIIDDSLNLARAGRIPYSTALSLALYLENERDYSPWAAANRALNLLTRWLTDSPIHEHYQFFVRRIVGPLYVTLGLEQAANEHNFVRYARTVAIDQACQAGLPACIDQTANRLRQFVTGIATIAPDLQGAIFCNGLRRLDNPTEQAENFNFLMNRLFASNYQSERSLIIDALGCAQDSSQLASFLRLSIADGYGIRVRERFNILNAAANNGAIGLRAMMDFIRKNSTEIAAIAPNHIDTVSSMLGNIAVRVSQPEIFSEFIRLLLDLNADGFLPAANVVSFISTAQNNIDWNNRFQTAIGSWLTDTIQITPPVQPTPSPTTQPPPEATPEVTTPSTTSTTQGAGTVVVSTFLLAACAVIKYSL